MSRQGQTAVDCSPDDKFSTLRHGITTVEHEINQDLLQLVDEDVSVLSPQKDEEVIFDQEKVQERFGIKPAQIAELVAFTGDAVDNIPAIKPFHDRSFK